MNSQKIYRTISVIVTLSILVMIFIYQKKIENWISSINLVENHRRSFYSKNIFGFTKRSIEVEFEGPEYLTLTDMLAHKKVNHVSIKGNLTLPEDDLNKKYPTVIYIPGRNGTFPEERKKQLKEILKNGFAVFTYSSMVAHGLESHHYKNSFNIVPYMTTDLMSAFVALTRHPNVLNTHIGVFGDCGGGSAVLLTSWSKVLEAFNVKNDFLFSVSLYPFCYPTEDRSFSKRNQLVLLAEKDEWALPRNCSMLIDDLKKNGSPVDVITYPNAGHGFDFNFTEKIETPAYPYEDCPWVIDSTGRFYSPKNAMEFNTPEQIALARLKCGGTNKIKFGGNNQELIQKSSEDIISFIKKFRPATRGDKI